VQKLSLHALDVCTPLLFPALANSCPQLTHLLLCRLTLADDAAQTSLGRLGMGLPALQQLAVIGIEPQPFVDTPKLLQRITLLWVEWGQQAGWQQALHRHPSSLQQWVVPFYDVEAYTSLCPAGASSAELGAAVSRSMCDMASLPAALRTLQVSQPTHRLQDVAGDMCHWPFLKLVRVGGVGSIGFCGL
jgi:hypothetical protein